MTRCIHVREAPSAWESNPDYVYIGRPGKGRPGPFGNPFRLAPGAPRGSTLEKYREYLLRRVARDPAFAAAVEGLRGKILVCFCKPNPCHGDVLAEYVDGRSQNPDNP